MKTCKNCTKEFNEKENFNWSCRTHQSEWGGEMWWCCGKTTKEALGCKFRKHETKDDEEEVDQTKEEREEEIVKMKRYQRCACCKELGHRMEDCLRDPNFRTNAETNADQMRINKIKDYKKLHVDSLVQQAHFIKKSVMVPIKVDDEGKVKEPDNPEHPFMRGIMNFDDYSYTQFNSYVLISEPHESEKRRVIADRKAALVHKEASEKDSVSTLTQEQLDRKGKFKHDEFSVEKLQQPTLAVEEETKQPAEPPSKTGESDKEVVKQLNKQLKDVKAEKSDIEDDGKGENDEAALVEDMGSASDPFIYKIFYKPSEIEKTESLQRQDLFEDLIFTRREAIFESGLLFGGNKINIADFAPTPVAVFDSKQKKQGRSKRATSD